MSTIRAKRKSLIPVASASPSPISPMVKTPSRTPQRKSVTIIAPQTPGSRANIHVCARFRPQLDQELTDSTIQHCDSTSVLIQGRESLHAFTYDHVFAPSASQLEVYDYTGKDAVNDLFDGYNGTILAYGQLGLGKLYTMVGPHTPVDHSRSLLANPHSVLDHHPPSISENPNSNSDLNQSDSVSNNNIQGSNPLQPAIDFPLSSLDRTNKQQLTTTDGIIPRIIREIFTRIALSPAHIEYTVAVLYMEIYMEQIRDLLDKNNSCTISEDSDGLVYVKGLSQVYVSLSSELISAFERGNRLRVTGATGMNAGSSRSHAIFQLRLTQKEGATFKKLDLFLVDLAGLEKVDRTGAVGQLLEEAKKINKLLSALGNVIFTLAEGKASHIPFRDLKLTRILQELLGGNARTTLIVNCSPSLMDEMETLSTLRFGSSAKKIKNKPIINTTLSVDGLKQKIIDLERELAFKSEYVIEMERRLQKQKVTSTTVATAAPGEISAEITLRDQRIKDLEDEVLLLQMSSLKNHHEEQSKLFQLEKLLLSFSDKLTELENANYKLTEDILTLTKMVEDRNNRIVHLEHVLKDQQMQISKESVNIENKLDLLREKLQKQTLTSRPLLTINTTGSDPSSPTSPRMGLNLRIVKPVNGGGES